MSFQYNHPQRLLSAASLVVSASSTSASILEATETKTNTEQLSFSPRLLILRPRKSSPPPEISKDMILPMSSKASMFDNPRLSNWNLSKSNSLKSRALPQLGSPSSLVTLTRPKSVPLFQHEWVRSPNMNSLARAATSQQPIHEYRPSQLQPNPASLPLPTKPTLHGVWLRTEAEKLAAIKERSKVLGASDSLSKVEAVFECSGESDSSTQKKVLVPKEPITGELVSKCEQYIILFSVRTQSFRRTRRSSIFTSSEKSTMVSELPEDIQIPAWLPPLLVDGRMTIDEIPRWRGNIIISWRSWDGQAARLYHKEIALPLWLWVERNLSKAGKGKEMNVFIERG